MLNSIPLRPRRRRFRRGFTLVEMMVAIAAGTIIMGAITWTSITLSHSLAAISNYYQLDAASRDTLDVMSRDVRNGSTITSFSSTNFTMTGVNFQGTPYAFTYNWDGTNLWRTFTITNATYTYLMLSNCNYLAFSNFTRVPYSNFTFYVASGASDTKLISVSWKCSRSILGAKLNTESVQTAKIVVRN
ncbi:MAG TPA: prepilin-type N-terminal cleavage/methylation domain-containing protein [Verrucomicrobiae bacterium]|jgi:prepilin-type N-terminal cleavage/methylation domain-containing protein|nr:prepilin-type N-terminal cleavage/methylation domain-containing protein [Verrucomicrobiae bacterium]